MSSDKKNRPPSNIHNDFALDQMDKEEDSRGLIALRDPQEAARLGKITALPTSFSDGKQRERRPDKAVKAEVLDDDGKVIGERGVVAVATRLFVSLASQGLSAAC